MSELVVPINEIAFGKPADAAGEVADDVVVGADAQAVGKIGVNAQPQRGAILSFTTAAE